MILEVSRRARRRGGWQKCLQEIRPRLTMREEREYKGEALRGARTIFTLRNGSTMIEIIGRTGNKKIGLSFFETACIYMTKFGTEMCHLPKETTTKN